MKHAAIAGLVVLLGCAPWASAQNQAEAPDSSAEPDRGQVEQGGAAGAESVVTSNAVLAGAGAVAVVGGALALANSDGGDSDDDASTGTTETTGTTGTTD